MFYQNFLLKYNLSIDLFNKNYEIPILLNLSLSSEHLTSPWPCLRSAVGVIAYSPISSVHPQKRRGVWYPLCTHCLFQIISPYSLNIPPIFWGSSTNDHLLTSWLLHLIHKRLTPSSQFFLSALISAINLGDFIVHVDKLTITKPLSFQFLDFVSS